MPAHLFVAEFVPLVTNPALDVALGTILAFSVALGLIYIVDVFLRAFFSFTEGVVAGTIGLIPGVGGWVKGKIEHAEQKATNKLGAAAHNLEGHIGDAFHATGNQIRSVGHEIFGLSVATYHLIAYLEGKIGMQILLPTLRHEQKLTAAERKRVAADEKLIHAQGRAIAHPQSGRIGAGIRAQTKPIAHRTTWIDTHELPNVRARQRAAERALPRDTAGLRERVRVAEDSIEGLWSRVKHLDRVTTGLLASALVATALGRLGAGWIRCSNWNRLGRGICRAPSHLIDDLLGLVTDFVVLDNICQILPWIEDGVSVVATPLIGTLSRVGAGVCHGSAGPADALRTPVLSLPANAGSLTLHLP